MSKNVNLTTIINVNSVDIIKLNKNAYFYKQIEKDEYREEDELQTKINFMYCHVERYIRFLPFLFT
jgi:hypothetical protein